VRWTDEEDAALLAAVLRVTSKPAPQWRAGEVPTADELDAVAASVGRGRTRKRT
jgi:hypothetical protein